MSLFKGFTQIDILERNPRTLCAILSEQLVLTNKAVETLSEELRQAKTAVSDNEMAAAISHENR